MSSGPQVTQQSKEKLVSELINCAKCGTSNPAGTRHCVNCGARLDLAPAKPQQEPAAEKKRGGLWARLAKKS
jgi:hypothetical protein